MSDVPSAELSNAPTLDEDSLAWLLDEVIAMARAERSLLFGFADIEAAASGKLGRAARHVQTRIEQGRSPAQAIAELSKKYQVPIQAGMQVMAETGSVEPLRETVRLIRESKENRYQMLLAAIHPMLSVIVAAVVVFWVMPWVMVTVADSQTVPSPNAPMAKQMYRAIADNFTAAALATAVLVGGFAALLYAALTRSSRRGDFNAEHATLCRWLAIQIESEHAIETARVIETAACAAGERFARAWKEVAERVRGGTQTVAALAMPESTPQPVRQCVSDLVEGRRDRRSIAHDLRGLSALYQQISVRNRTWWTEGLPKMMTFVLMLGIVGTLIVTVLSPLLEIISVVS